MLTKLGNWLRNFLPLDNSAPLMVVLFIIVAAFIAFMAMSRRTWGAEPSIQASWGYAVIRGETPALNLAWDYPSGHGADAIRASLTLIGHSTFQGQEYPNNYAFGIQYFAGYKQFDIGIGPSWMQNPRPFNGSNVNFNITLAFRFEQLPVTLSYMHWSCGGACTPNYGRDLALIGYRF